MIARTTSVTCCWGWRFPGVEPGPPHSPNERRFFHGIPTVFSLTEEQVDGLIEAGGKLLQRDTEYQQLLQELAGGTM